MNQSGCEKLGEGAGALTLGSGLLEDSLREIYTGKKLKSTFFSQEFCFAYVVMEGCNILPFDFLKILSLILRPNITRHFYLSETGHVTLYVTSSGVHMRKVFPRDFCDKPLYRLSENPPHQSGRNLFKPYLRSFEIVAVLFL